MIILTDTTIRSDILRAKIHQNYSRNVKKYMDTIDLDYYLYNYFHYTNRALIIKNSIFYKMLLNTRFKYKNYVFYINDYSYYNCMCTISRVYMEKCPYKYKLKNMILSNELNTGFYMINKANEQFYIECEDDVIIIGEKAYINLYDYDLKRLL